MNTFQVLSSLSNAVGVSGYELSAVAVAEKHLANYGTTYTDSMGNLFCKAFDYNEKLPTILLDAHIDEIGFVVNYITDDGFLKISACGGIDRRVLLAQQVTVCGKEMIKGVVTSTPPHLEKDSSSCPKVEDVYVDVGMTADEVKKLVSLGDYVFIDSPARMLINYSVTSKALDNRAGCTAVIKTLELLSLCERKYNVLVCFSVQEELGLRGAKPAAFSAEFDEAIVVDVSFAKTHGESPKDCGVMGKGPMIGISPTLSRKMSDSLRRIAENKLIPYQLEVMSGRTGTNADAIGLSAGGKNAVTVSIPLKHMHTPAEIVDLNDIENTAKLICEYISDAE